MTTNSVTHGVVGSTTVTSNVDSGGLATTSHVTLSANYARVVPSGYPDPNAGSNPATNPTHVAKTLLSGARVLFFTHEAKAIVAAGGGTLS